MSKIRLHDLDEAHSGFALLDVVPDTHAWLKDTDGRFVNANQLFLRRFNYQHPDQLLGKNDFDLSEAYMASGYVRDDELALSGEVITDRLELINNHDEEPTWFLTSKWPVYNYDDEIIGTFGFSRHLQKTDISLTPFRDLNAPVEYIREHYMDALTVAQLANFSHISISALERRFKKHLGKTPRQYITEIRLDRARHLMLETNSTLGEIAHLTGFSDQSHFTRAYSQRFNVNPSTERKRYKQ
ncbi:MAG: helix-turn-helix domain-containing protein [Pseudomonadales bacterium]